MEIPCNMCGVAVEVPESLAHWGACCDDCCRKSSTDQSRHKRSDLLNQHWVRMCPQVYADTVFDRLPSPDHSQKAMEWPFGEQPNGYGLMLWGWPSTGKTRTMWLILKREHFAGKSVVAFGPGEWAYEAERRNYRRAGWISRLNACDILAFDDVDKFRLTHEQEQALFSIVETRTSKKRPIFFTGNVNGEVLTLNFRLGEPLVRRIREFCVAVHFPKPNETET